MSYIAQLPSQVYFTLMILWVLTGILAKLGWIRPTGIVWIDAVIIRAEYSVWDFWKKVGKWMAQAGLIMLLCFSAALTLFAAVWHVFRP